MTWSVQDPSLSHATSRAIRNVLGYPGAIGADLLMQILGLGAIMLILPVAVWGWRMLTHRAFDREALRLGCWILCTVIAAGFASCWPHGGAWPLPTGLGGVVGDALVRAPAVVFGPAGFIYRLVLGIILFARHDGRLPVRLRLGLAPARGRGADADRGRRRAVRRGRGEPQLGFAGLDVPRHHEREGADRLALRHRLSLAGLQRARRQGVSFERQEPNLDGRRAPSIAPQDDDEEDEDEEEDEEEEEPVARAPRKKAAPRQRREEILRQVRTAVGVGAHCAEGLATASRSARPSSRPIRARWKACSAISASAARSSNPIPGPS